MALKKKITKKNYDDLEDSIKALYKEKGDDYILDLEGSDNDDAIDELRRAKEREAQEAKDLRAKLRAAEKKLEDIGGDDARKRGDIEALEKSWKEKYERREQELNDTIGKKDGYIRQMLVQERAENLAQKISNAPGLMKRVLQDRLAVDMEGDTPSLKVLDKDGKPSAATLDDLEKEIVADKEFATIVIGSKASGGGAGTDASQGKSGANPNSGNNAVDFSKMTPQQHAEHLKAAKQQ